MNWAGVAVLMAVGFLLFCIGYAGGRAEVYEDGMRACAKRCDEVGARRIESSIAEWSCVCATETMDVGEVKR